MSREGVWQLKKLTLRFCKEGGSSKGIRNFIDKNLESFKLANPHIQIEHYEGRRSHPFVKGEYVHGNEKVISVRNMTEDQIEDTLLFLRNQWGETARPGWKKEVEKAKESIQGSWSPFVDYSK